MKLPTVDLSRYQQETRDGGIRVLIDEGGGILAELPAWVPDQHATEVFTLLLSHEKRGRQLGSLAGEREERERLRLVLEPLAQAIARAATPSHDE